MPSHLHPRSSATTTLFASTLAASFIIVGIPHIFPCPAPRRAFSDSSVRSIPADAAKSTTSSHASPESLVHSRGQKRTIGNGEASEQSHGAYEHLAALDHGRTKNIRRNVSPEDERGLYSSPSRWFWKLQTQPRPDRYSQSRGSPNNGLNTSDPCPRSDTNRNDLTNTKSNNVASSRVTDSSNNSNHNIQQPQDDNPDASVQADSPCEVASSSSTTTTTPSNAQESINLSSCSSLTPPSHPLNLSQFQSLEREESLLQQRSRECPVPKPRGYIGELLGFGRDGQRKSRREQQ